MNDNTKVGLSLLLAVLVGWGGSNAAKAQTCSVVAGDFEHVWGGLNQNVFMLDSLPSVAWTVEDGARMRLTINGGNSWQSLTTPPCVQDLLRGVQFLHDGPIRTGWAVGDGGHVLQTTDGGGAWQEIATLNFGGEPAELWDIDFLDPDIGWVGGNHLLKYTINGGADWLDVTANHPQNMNFDIADVEIYALDFVKTDDQGGYVGLASAEPGIILRTDSSSSGMTWDVVYDFCNAPRLCSGCAPLPDNCATSEEFELWDVELQKTFSDADEIRAIVSGGFGNQCGHILVSEDSGLTWGQEFNVEDDSCNFGSCTEDPNVPAFAYPTQYGTHTLDDGSGLSVGYGGSVFKRNTSCTPAVWELTSPIPGAQSPSGNFSQPFFGVDGTGSGRAWTSAMFNGLFETSDGGVSWTASSDGNDVMRLNDVYFATATKGWAVGQGFRITQSLDGGLNWTDQPSPPAAGVFRDIVFDANEMDGVAVGGFYDNSGDLEIRNSGNGGSTWSAAASISGTLPTTDRNLNAVTQSSGSQYWAVGESGVVLHTSNAGVDWDYAPIDLGGGPITTVQLFGVAFADANTGTVVGRQNGQARVYVVRNASNPATRVWEDHSPAPAARILEFQGAAVQGGRGVIVGKKLVAGNEVGTVFSWNGATYVEDLSVPSVEFCETFDGNGDPQLFGLFNEVAIPTSGPEVFVGGTCGRFLRFDGTGWEELKSELSMNVSGMSFYAADGGFVYGYAGSHGVLVKYDTN